MKMKRFVLFSFLMATAMVGRAQSAVGMWSLTPRIGINSSNMSNESLFVDFDTSLDSKRKTGFVVGVDAEYQHAWSQSLAIGAWYSTEGYRYDDVPAIVADMKQSMDFLHLSALENLYIAKGLAVKAGLQLGYRLSARQKRTDVESGIAYDEDNGQVYHKWNLSLPIGLSYEYRQFVLDLRYNIGLLNMCAIDALDTKWRTNSLWLTLGYKIDLN